MKRFFCDACGSEVYFDSTVCVSCGHRLGFRPGQFDVVALLPAGSDFQLVSSPAEHTRYCANEGRNACNWLLPAETTDDFCFACQHNHKVPDLSDPKELENWQNLEEAKRHLFYSILRWDLSAPTLSQSEETGLAFDFLADRTNPDGSAERVLSGHADGMITINIAEGDDAERERRRTDLNEPYRTLIGHFRHESGHYFWDRLVRDGGRLDEFRRIFGDERADYGESLKAHYANGPRSDWSASYVSAYASAHPWEDFAETWSHYIHITDALETARAFAIAPGDADPYAADNASELMDAWIPAAIALNAINRSMGQQDLYPFVLTEAVRPKLEFIHTLIHGLPAETQRT